VRLARYTLAPCGSRTQLFRSRGANRARGFAGSHPRTMEGAGKTGYPLIPMVRVQQKARGRTTGSANNRPSLRDGFNGCFVLSVGTGVLAPIRVMRSIIALRQRACAHCADISTGMSGPHDLTVRIELFVRMNGSRCNPIRPPHPRLAYRDDRAYAPPLETG
jgi:hypothetical protein